MHLDDEGAAGAVVGIAVDLHDAVRRLLDVELERLEDEVGAQPHVLAVPRLQGRAEHVLVGRTHLGPGAVAGEHQVVLRTQHLRIRRRRAEVDGDAEVGAAALQDAQELLAAHGGEAVSARGGRRAAEVDVDVVPPGEVPLHLPEHGRVGVLDAPERLVGEDDPETERVVGGVALPDGHLVRGVQLLDQCGEVQPARTSADNRDAHGSSSSSGGPWANDMPLM
ncbi:hypothetical protein [Blastococcus brunescens]|uniref:Uncharacterized protein n=1 Tax=Blastococcus brunescens TaxID=1564165 RepID=A0ABZ1B702_9ACTN|nr:hypothetical protein [Blastococcus sp. BMG 8361]WRL66524.1 hypothetical protein U6N30_14590 [Blastococcus sp. BMG 8361]